ncbi:MAG: fructose 1,6-bisphosphatase, partial [Chloroflexota bacterium]|nr:fructose 1,6-bisphosphatase [Chloroflexota bacterium]
MITLSVIKADIGGYVGHSSMHPDLMVEGQEWMTRAKKEGLLIDFHVTRCGDDLELIMTHEQGEGSERIHKLAWDTFL